MVGIGFWKDRAILILLEIIIEMELLAKWLKWKSSIFISGFKSLNQTPCRVVFVFIDFEGSPSKLVMIASAELDPLYDPLCFLFFLERVVCYMLFHYIMRVYLVHD